jgi:hypothetical protein
LDLDWFVGEDKLVELTKKLINMGYTPYPAINTFNAAQWKYFKSTHHDIYFSPPNEKSNLPIELHWRLRSPWGTFNLIPVGSLNELDEFLYLCVHGTEHGWFRLKWLVDLPRIIEKISIDWIQAWKRAKELNCQKQLLITLLVLDKLFLFAFPGELRKMIKPQEYDFELGYIQRVISAEITFNENDKTRLAYFRYLWSFRGTNWSLSIFKQFLTSPADWEMIRLPEAFFPLYFFLRPFIWSYRRLSSKLT